jgi:butyryl-CoA dehydrogenase
MATRIETARQMVLHVAALTVAGLPSPMEACTAKLVASEAAEWACSEAIQTFGGYGFLTDFPVERLYRDVRVCRIYEGTNDIQHLVIPREIQKRHLARVCSLRVRRFLRAF